MKKRFENLDVLRCFGALLILSYHYYGVISGGFFSKQYYIDYLIKNGNYAVDMFFLLSGFCLSANYKQKYINKEINFFEFFKKNYFKFVSYAIITMPVSLIKQYLMFKNDFDARPTALGIFLDISLLRTGWGLGNEMPYNSPLWFICVLFIVYVIYYFICYVSINNQRYLLYSVVCFLIGLYLLYHLELSFLFFTEITGRGICNFFIGVLLFELYRRAELSADLYKALKRISIAILILFTILFLLKKMQWLGNERLSISLMFFPSLIWILVCKKDNKSKVKDVILSFSKYSNSIFIWHHPIIYMVYGLNSLNLLSINMNSIICYIIFSVGIIIWSIISKNFLENKI